ADMADMADMADKHAARPSWPKTLGQLVRHVAHVRHAKTSRFSTDPPPRPSFRGAARNLAGPCGAPQGGWLRPDSDRYHAPPPRQPPITSNRSPLTLSPAALVPPPSGR